jgi:glutathione S-transferase
MDEYQLLGRRASHYTRVVRMFAHELGLPLSLVTVHDLKSLDSASYGGHPALKLPLLRVGSETVMGTEQICRRLARDAARPAWIVWPEDLTGSLYGNAQELVWQAMAAHVQWIMATRVGRLPEDNVFVAKGRAGLEGALQWLDANLDEVLPVLPPGRDFSLLEVTLHCLLEHLVFCGTLSLGVYPMLERFAGGYAQRASAQATQYEVDPRPMR